jgi:thiosulfate dehydrogenase [quinone] large subunit
MTQSATAQPASIPPAPAHTADPAALWRTDCFALIALVVLGIRFVQGFIFWGGASRRLLYSVREIDGVDLAIKLDFNGPGFVAAKLTHALPGTLWIQAPLEWMLRFPDLIVASVWFWTFAELAVGLALIFGLLTRLAAFASIGLNVALMLIFGWMGSTCLDEWTMAVSGVAMSSAVFLAGGGAWSLDRFIGRTTWAARDGWTNWLFSGPLPVPGVRALGLALAAAAIVFTVGSYNILFGAVVSPLHARVNFHRHHIALSDVTIAADGAVTFKAYVNAGPDTGAAYVIAARLIDGAGAIAALWDGAALAALPQAAIRNVYPYVWAAQFRPATIGFGAVTGARATIALPPAGGATVTSGGKYTLVLEAVSGAKWQAAAISSGGQ